MDNCIKFACVGDWGNGNNNQYLVGNLLSDLGEHGDIDFVCGLGDNFYPNGLSSHHFREEVNEKFTKPFTNCNLPFYMVLGNHDYLGKVDLEIDEVTKIDDRWIMPNEYYDFIMEVDEIKAHFICFDSNYPYYTPNDWSYQLKWIERRLLKYKNKTTWTILVAHHPWKSYGSHGNSKSILKDLYEYLTNKYNIDFILNGHDHDKQLIITKNKTKQIICGTGSVMRHFPTRPTGTSNLRFYSETIGVCQIKLFTNKAIVYFLDEHGNEEYQALFLPKTLINKKTLKAKGINFK